MKQSSIFGVVKLKKKIGSKAHELEKQTLYFLGSKAQEKIGSKAEELEKQTSISWVSKLKKRLGAKLKNWRSKALFFEKQSFRKSWEHSSRTLRDKK